jgi:hypothetical protein
MEMNHMIDKKFVAIVLAVGLIAAISCVVGQDKDEYAMKLKQETLAKEQAVLEAQQPAAQETQSTQMSTSEPAVSGSTEPTLPSTERPIIERIFNRYSTRQYSSECQDRSAMAHIGCYQDETLVGDLTFMKDGSTMPQNNIAMYSPSRPLEIYFYISRYDNIVALLERDGLKRLIFNSNSPEAAYIEVMPTM